MKTYPLDERYLSEWVSLLQQDLLCIYPTDSLYGIGGIANRKNAEVVKRIKGRGVGKSFSVLVPSLQWVRDYCSVPESFATVAHQKPVTYLFQKKDKNTLLHLSENECIGVRLLSADHVIQKLVTTLQQPLITTSANYTGEPVGATLEEMPLSLLQTVDFVIDAGVRLTTPSRLYDVATGREVCRV